MLHIGKIISHVTVTGLGGGSGPRIRKKSATGGGAADAMERQALAVEHRFLQGTRPAPVARVPAAPRIQRSSLGADRLAGRYLGPSPGALPVLMKGGLGDASSVRGLLASSPSQPMSSGIRASMEDYFGSSFRDVKLHTDPAATRAADAMGAKAFTFGSHIFMGSGAPGLTTPEGGALLGHELTHVLQFRREGSGFLPRTHGGTLASRLEAQADATEKSLLADLRSRRTGAHVQVAVERFTVDLPGDLASADRRRADRIAHRALASATRELGLTSAVSPGVYPDTVRVQADFDPGLDEDRAVELLAQRISLGLIRGGRRHGQRIAPLVGQPLRDDAPGALATRWTRQFQEIADYGSRTHGLLGSWEARRAQAVLEDRTLFSDREYIIFVRMLKRAGSNLERVFIIKALAAGNDRPDIEWLAGKIRGEREDWLLNMLTLGDPSSQGRGIKQQFSHTCQVTTVQAIRGHYDPVYAFRLRTGAIVAAHGVPLMIDDAGQIHGALPQGVGNASSVNESDALAMNPNLAAEQAAMTTTSYTGSIAGMAGHAGVLDHRITLESNAPRATVGRGRFVDDWLNRIGRVTGLSFQTRLGMGPHPDRVVQMLETFVSVGMLVPVIVGPKVDSHGMATTTGSVKEPKKALFHKAGFKFKGGEILQVGFGGVWVSAQLQKGRTTAQDIVNYVNHQFVNAGGDPTKGRAFVHDGKVGFQAEPWVHVHGNSTAAPMLGLSTGCIWGPVIQTDYPTSHYVLCLGFRQQGATREFQFYDPWEGRAAWFSEHDIRNGHLNLGGHTHISALDEPAPA